MRAGKNAGIHLIFNIYDEWKGQVGEGRAGLFDAEVAPGAHIDLTMVLPALGKAGRYRVLADMIDEQNGWFFQMGSEPLELELEVRE